MKRMIRISIPVMAALIGASFFFLAGSPARGGELHGKDGDGTVTASAFNGVTMDSGSNTSLEPVTLELTKALPTMAKAKAQNWVEAFGMVNAQPVPQAGGTSATAEAFAISTGTITSTDVLAKGKLRVESTCVVNLNEGCDGSITVVGLVLESGTVITGGTVYGYFHFAPDPNPKLIDMTQPSLTGTNVTKFRAGASKKISATSDVNTVILIGGTSDYTTRLTLLVNATAPVPRAYVDAGTMKLILPSAGK